MFAYCGNDPVNLIDSEGCAPEYTGDPQYEWIWDFGWWLKERTDEEEEKIENGEVSYSSNGAGKGAKIRHSFEITMPWVMYNYVTDNRGEDIEGSTIGVVVEWIFHNGAHLLGSALGNEGMVNQAKDLEVGKTIYSDQRAGFNASSFMSLGMKLAYTALFPITAAYDLYVETGRTDFLYVQ